METVPATHTGHVCAHTVHLRVHACMWAHVFLPRTPVRCVCTLYTRMCTGMCMQKLAKLGGDSL